MADLVPALMRSLTRRLPRTGPLPAPLTIRWTWVATAVLILAGSATIAFGQASGGSDAIRASIDAGEYASAETAARAYLADLESASPMDSLEVAETLRLLAIAMLQGGKVKDPETADFAARSVELHEAVLGNRDGRYAGALNILAVVYAYAGRGEDAARHFEELLTYYKDTLEPGHPTIAGAVENVAGMHFQNGRFDRAAAFYRETLATLEAQPEPDPTAIARTLSNLGNTLFRMGDYAAARPLQERALGLREQSLGETHPDVAYTLSDLATLAWRTADYPTARANYERALEIRTAGLGPDHPDVASTLNNLGLLFQDMGDGAGAMDRYREALAIKERTLGAEDPGVAPTLNNMARLLMEEGNVTDARPLYERALAVRETGLGPDHVDVAASLSGLADALFELGDASAARTNLERALAIREAAQGADHPRAAEEHLKLAYLHRSAGRTVDAKRHATRAVAIREGAFGPDHPLLAKALTGLAAVTAEAGSIEDGLDLALRAETIGREHLTLTVKSLAEDQALRYAAARISGLDLALTLAGKSGNGIYRRDVLDALIRSRALVLDEMAARKQTVRGATEIAGIAEDLSAATQRLANLQVRGASGSSEQYRRQLEEARESRRRAELALAQSNVAFQRQLTERAVGFDAVRRSLSPGDALVSYVIHEQDPGGGADPDTVYTAFVLRGSARSPELVTLGSRGAVERAVRNWTRHASAAPASAADETEYRAVADRLRRLVWDPVAERIGDASRVFIVPDGSLHLVSFTSFPSADGGYLVESGPLLHYLSAERDLAADPVTGSGDGLLALGGVDFDLEGSPRATDRRGGGATAYRGKLSECPEFKEMRFAPLPATETEAATVTALWDEARARRRTARDAASEGPRPSNVTRLGGKDADEASFKASAAGHRVLHLATHGFFLGRDCPSAIPGVRGLGRISSRVSDAPPPVSGENLLLLAGLALSGANQRNRIAPGSEDGILTAEEIAALDLSGVEWAVLSACDTGVGEVQVGEGVFGLRRAFEVAGAGSLIMSLWSVQDEPTRKWMEALYRARLVDGMTTAEAVRHAGRTLLERRRAAGDSTHPFFWAAFVAAGDWR